LAVSPSQATRPIVSRQTSSLSQPKRCHQTIPIPISISIFDLIAAAKSILKPVGANRAESAASSALFSANRRSFSSFVFVRGVIQLSWPVEIRQRSRHFEEGCSA